MAGPFFSDVLARYDAAGQLALLLDLRRGGIRDLSANSQAVAFVGGPRWGSNSRGYSLDLPLNGGSLAVTDAASLRLTAGGTLLHFGVDCGGKIALSRLIAKRTGAGGTNYDFFFGTATRLDIYDGTTTSSCGTSQVGTIMNGVSWTQGARPRFFVNGSFLDLGNNAITIPNTAVALYVGSYENTLQDYSGQQAVAVLSTQVSDADILRIYRDFLVTKGQLRGAVWNIRWGTPPEQEGDVRLDLEMSRNPAGVLPDRSAYGNNGTPSNGIAQAPGAFSEAQKFPGGTADAIALGAPASLLITGAADLTLSAWFKQRNAGFNTLISRQLGGARGFLLLVWNDGRLAMLDAVGAAWAIGGTTGMSYGWCHGAGTKSGTRWRVFEGGVEVYAMTGNALLNTNAADSAYVGYDVTPRTADGTVDNPVIKATGDSPEQIYRSYLRGAKKPYFQDDFRGYPVLPAAVPTGGQCGPLTVASGSMIVGESATKSRYVMASGGLAIGYYQNAEEAPFGMWEFEVYVTGSGALIDFGASSFGYAGAGYTALNGYELLIAPVFVRLYRVTAGAALTLMQFAGLPVDTLYRFRVYRRPIGYFTIFVKGGTFPDWALMTATAGAQPTSDLTHTTGTFTTFTLNANGYVSFSQHLQGCPRPTSFPWEYPLAGANIGSTVSSGLVWKTNVNSSLVFLPRDMDYDVTTGRRGWRTIENRIYHAAGGVTDTILARELLASAVVTQYGYTIRITAAGRVQYLRVDNGVETLIDETGDAFLADATEYQRRITRDDTTGLTEVYFKGGAYASWTLATSVVSLIHTTMNYLVSDFDAGDRETAPSFYDYIRSEP